MANVMSESILKQRVLKLISNRQFSKYLYDEKSDPRVLWLKNFSEFAKDAGLDWAVAECGVHLGCFAYYINKYFESKKFYLFDTFAGFARQDIEEEIASNPDFVNTPFANVNAFTGADGALVLANMPHPRQCIILNP
jgi:O-methyltransferase